jgi:hypothetical protein
MTMNIIERTEKVFNHINLPLTAAKRDCWFSVTGNFVFTKKVLSWQRKLSPLESQPRLSRETLGEIITPIIETKNFKYGSKL